MPAAPKGSVRFRDGKWFARVSYTDADGKRHYPERAGKNKTHAQQILRQLLNSIDAGGVERKRDVPNLSQLVQYYRDNHAHAPVVANGERVSGLASWENVVRHCDTILSHFGNVKLTSITYGALDRFRRERLQASNERGGKMSPASVHRELATLRTMLNVARRERWIPHNPFGDGPPLIRVSIEKKRDRVLSADEERRLLAACYDRTTVKTSATGKKYPENVRRGHLRPVVILALDTGARKSELMGMRWREVDWEKNQIRFRTLKQRREVWRFVGMTSRVRAELERLKVEGVAAPDALVFPAQDLKRSFDSALTEAEIEDFRFHDLRHTCGTRLVQAGISLAEVARLLGHEQVATTFRYLHADDETASRAAAALDARFTPPDAK